ncbi:MAG: AAA family ATPase [Ruminococcus flavefaciens]|nr:AAA family ATPase [Ruminococcus flavefaciens]MCM1061240.1 AAA family ATPase [Eubacterium sp.]
MKRFYITSITATGSGVHDSTITFEKGVNIIYGPSDTGKSYIMKCIDFMFCCDGAPFTRADTGYDAIAICFENDDGEKITVKRKIVDGTKNGEPIDRGDSKVYIETTLNNYLTKEYKKEEYQSLLLKLFGIDEEYKLISNKDFKQANLKLRSFFHLFFLDEDHIFQAKEVFFNPNFPKTIFDFMILLFLFSGKDYNELVPTESTEDKNKKALQKKGVIKYLREKVKNLTERHEEARKKLLELGDVNVESKLNEIITEIFEIDREISELKEKSHQYMSGILSVKSRLQEARVLSGRYKALHTQYLSDIKRLNFISDGDKKAVNIRRLTKCPFCESKMHEQLEHSESFAEATSIELKRVKLQLQDLQEVEKDVADEIVQLEAELEILSAQYDEILNHLKELKPKAENLKITKDNYLEIIAVQQNVYAFEMFSKELDAEAAASECESDDGNPEFSVKLAKQYMEKNTWQKMSDTFADIVKACEYPNFTTGNISINSMDAIINGKHKSSHGKGYRAFLNTILLFSLMKSLEENGRYAMHFLFLDSPILSLKEKKIEISDSEKITDGMKEALFRYLIENCGENQIIIIENDIPENVDYSKAHLIEFTKDEKKGRYGFLKNYKA